VDLEHRVKVLEQELEILKNQVQATLLDIQEQLLSSYHPALRAGHVNGSDGFDGAPVEAGPEVARQSNGESSPSTNEDTLVLSRPNVKTIAAHDLQREPGLTPGPNASEEPVVHRVSLKDMLDEEPPEDDFYPAEVEELAESPEPPEPAEQAAPAAADLPYEEEPDYQPAPPPPARVSQTSLMGRLSAAAPETRDQSEIDWGTFTTLTDWVSDNLEKMGASRMRRMVNTVTQQVSISPELEDALMQMITLYEEDSALEEVRLYETARAVSRGLSDAQAAAPSYEGYEDEVWYDELSEEPEPTWKRSLIRRLIDGLESLDDSQEDDRG
jgi:hypothetical protein